LPRSGCGQREPWDADGDAECLRGVVGQGEAVVPEELPGVAHGERGPQAGEAGAVGAVGEDSRAGGAGADVGGRAQPDATAVTLALATSAPVVFQLLSVGDSRVVRLDGRGGGGSLNPVGEGIAGPVQVVGGRRGAQAQAVVDGPRVVVRIVVPFRSVG